MCVPCKEVSECVRVHVCVVRACDGAVHAHPCPARRTPRKIGSERYASVPRHACGPPPSLPHTPPGHGGYAWPMAKKNPLTRPGTHHKLTPPLTPLPVIPPPSPRSSRSAAPATGPARRTVRAVKRAPAADRVQDKRHRPAARRRRRRLPPRRVPAPAHHHLPVARCCRCATWPPAATVTAATAGRLCGSAETARCGSTHCSCCSSCPSCPTCTICTSVCSSIGSNPAPHAPSAPPSAAPSALRAAAGAAACFSGSGCFTGAACAALSAVAVIAAWPLSVSPAAASPVAIELRTIATSAPSCCSASCAAFGCCKVESRGLAPSKLLQPAARAAAAAGDDDAAVAHAQRHEEIFNCSQYGCNVQPRARGLRTVNFDSVVGGAM